MTNDALMGQGGGPRAGKGNRYFSFPSISGYLRIMSSGASSVASTVKSVGASVVSSLTEDSDLRDQVNCAAFDKLECEDNELRQVLLLGYRSGFEVWDVEEADDVRKIASSQDGLVSFMQLQKKPVAPKRFMDRFAEVRPLLVIACDRSPSDGVNNYDGSVSSVNNSSSQEHGYNNLLPTSIHFYSLKTNAFMHVLKFRSAIYSIRCSPRIVAILQAAQIHCFDAATLEREYTVLTYPIVSGSIGSGGMGYGPLAVGSRWLAYSGSPVAISNTGRVSPQHLTPANSLSSAPNGNIVVHYAKESSKQFASGIMALGDMGYKKLSKYCSDVLLQDGNVSLKQRNPSSKSNGTINGNLPDTDNAGMVIVRDIVSKSVVVQFRAHRSPISALCFDPSGILLVTASIHGHNINVFCVMPSFESSSGSDASGSCAHLYRLQRGFTNAIIQDISFSDDSHYIMISSSRGTSHLFALSPSGGNMSKPYSALPLTTKAPVWWPPGSGMQKLNQNNIFTTGPPIALSVISRIRNGNNVLKGALSGAAAAATGKVNPFCGIIASTFHNCKGGDIYQEVNSLRTKYYFLVFPPSGCVIQYVLHHMDEAVSGTDLPGLNFGSIDLSQDNNTGLVVEALQKWDVCHKQSRRDYGNVFDIYGENSNGDGATYLTKETKKGTSLHRIDHLETKRLSTEDKHHLYISEVELHTHPIQIPMWTKPNTCFQLMTDDFSKINFSTLDGEIELERIPTRIIEARSKDLIPAFEYHQRPRFHPSRTTGTETEISENGPLEFKKSGLTEDVSLSHRNSCSSIECMSEGAVTDIPSAVTSNGLDIHEASLEPPVNFVDNSERLSVSGQLGYVNNADGPRMKAQLEHVNSREILNMETRFEDGANE